MPIAREFRRIEPDRLVGTIDELARRITVNLGERGLTRIARELIVVAQDTNRRARRLRQPNWALRLVPWGVAGLVGYLSWMMSRSLGVVEAKIDMVVAQDLRELARAVKQLMDHLALPIALVVPLPFVLAIFAFIWSLESRWKRAHVLRYLHELRSIIHVIDMHQLTKDPYRISDGSDPEFLTGEKLVRYLDHCAELLSLSAKVAALYAEASEDPVVISTVNDLGQLTSDLSNKIWQKLSIAERGLPNHVATQVPG